MTNPFDLSGKTAIVTGANTGIGQGIAVALAQAGAWIAGVGRSAMDETQRRIAQGGGAFRAVAADLSSIEPVARIVDETVAWSGRVDILVNNAGIIRRGDPLDFTEQDWDDVINVNLKSYFFLAQAFARRVVEQGGGGKIVNIASVLAFQGGIRIPSYTASKHGVAGLTRLLGQRMGRERHQRQRDRARLLRDQQHAGDPRRSRPQRRHPGAHPGRPLGHARRYGRRGGVPLLSGGGLLPWHRPGRGRRMAGAVKPRAQLHLSRRERACAGLDPGSTALSAAKRGRVRGYSLAAQA